MYLWYGINTDHTIYKLSLRLASLCIETKNIEGDTLLVLGNTGKGSCDRDGDSGIEKSITVPCYSSIQDLIFWTSCRWDENVSKGESAAV
jgi:hypothetical protein